MATFQSQIDILARNMIELYHKIEGFNPNNFSLVKLNYNNSLGLEDNPSFQTLPTYVLAMDIRDEFECEQYDVSLGVYESTIDDRKFKYVVPTKYEKNSEFTRSVSTFTSDFIHCHFDANNKSSFKVLFNFPQIISLYDSLSLNSKYVDDEFLDYEEISDIFVNDETIIREGNIDSQPQTKKTTEIIKQLRDLKSQNEARCIDLIDEKLESLIYNNIYEITENGKLILKEHTNHPLKKNMNIPTSEDIYILECDSNTKYLLEC